MQQILNTLYVMTPNAYVHLENDTLRVDVEHEKKMQVPLLPLLQARFIARTIRGEMEGYVPFLNR